MSKGLISNEVKENQAKPSRAMRAVINDATVHVSTMIEEDEREDEPERVLYLFEPNSLIRRFFVFLGSQILFDVIVFASIAVSCVFLIITPPYEDLPGVKPLISYELIALLNFVFTIVFTIEFFVRVLSQGLIFTKTAYFKSGWNILDSLVLFFAWIDESGVLPEGRVAKVFRLARALRPLRLMKRNVGMRIVIDALICTMKPVAYVIMFSVFTFCVFALVGQGLFGGRLYRCNMPGAEYPGGKAECSGHHVTLDSGFLVQRVWSNPSFHFDDYEGSVLTLFTVNTIKYVDIIYDVSDITRFDQSPKEGFSGELALFFVVYLIVVCTYPLPFRALFITTLVD